MNLQGKALTRCILDDLSSELDATKINIRCDAWAFIKIKDMYEGWLEIPHSGYNNKIVMCGIHPIMKDFIVEYTKEHKKGELEFLDDEGRILAEIKNYSVTM